MRRRLESTASGTKNRISDGCVFDELINYDELNKLIENLFPKGGEKKWV